MRVEETGHRLSPSDFGRFNMREKFEALKGRVGNDVRNVWEVYVNDRRNSLIYRSIASIGFEEMVTGREMLANRHHLSLIGIEVTLEKILDHDPDSARRTGCFRMTEWLTAEFTPTITPVTRKDVKRFLDRESGWSRGGPR